MTVNRAAFYAAVRSSLFGGRLTEPQVQGLDALLTAAPPEMPLDHLAYCLATAFHETAKTMQPIKEYGGTAYYKRMYDIQGERPKKARELGNLIPGDGAKYAGRGYVQLTGRVNYVRASKEIGFDLVTSPDLAMQPGIAALILYSGMTAGWFTGKKLSDYFRPGLTEPYQARRIINGLDRAGDIAGYYHKFVTALADAQLAPPAPVPPPPDIEPVAAAPAKGQPIGALIAGVMAALLALAAALGVDTVTLKSMIP